MDSSPRLTLVCVIAVAMATTAFAIEKPVGLIGKMISNNRADLHWFQKGVNDTILAYDDGDSDCPVSVIEEDRDNRAAVKFNRFSSPVYVLGGYVYVLNYDPDPSLPGSPLSPIEISLHLDGGEGPGEMIAGPVVVQSDGVWTEEGQWLYAGFEKLHGIDCPLWVQVRWPSSNPFMPKLGGDGHDKDFMSVVGYFDGDDDVWMSFPDYDIMMRLALLLNTSQVIPAHDGADLDSFNIYSSDDLCSDSGFGQWLASNGDSMLHRRVDVMSSSCCFFVTTWRGDSESDPSGSIQLHGLPGSVAPAIVGTSQLDLSVTVDQQVTAHVSICSQSGNELGYEYTALHDTSGLNVKVLNGSGSLQPFVCDSIGFVIDSSELTPGEFYVYGQISFRDTSEVYQPVETTLHLTVNAVTSATETDPRIPKSYRLSQNYPNPFNSRTVIEISYSFRSGKPSVDIFDLLGRRVVRLLPSGVFGEVVRYEWDARDESGNECPSGIYFYAVSNRNSECRKMLLLK